MNSLMLKELPQGECPHHRLAYEGVHTLKTSELLALIIRQGNTPKAMSIAGELIQIKVTDHVIIGDGCYISMKEERIVT